MNYYELLCFFDCVRYGITDFITDVDVHFNVDGTVQVNEAGVWMGKLKGASKQPDIQSPAHPQTRRSHLSDQDQSVFLFFCALVF